MTTPLQRRHFKLIADVIAGLVLSDDEHDAEGLEQVESLRRSIAEQFASALASSNGRFDRERFVSAACKPRS
jgi:hypothetical protein